MRYLILPFLAAGCGASSGRPPTDTAGVIVQLAALETRLLQNTFAADTDDCTRAVRQAKQNGGVVYVDRNGHCTFVRSLPGGYR